MWSAKNKALHEQVDSLNKQLKAVRAENKRYLAQHHDDQIEMHNLRVENEQLQLLQDARKEKSKVIVDLENEIKSLKNVVSNLRINEKNQEKMMIQTAKQLKEQTKECKTLQGKGKDLSDKIFHLFHWNCLLYTSPSPRDKRQSRMPSSA